MASAGSAGPTAIGWFATPLFVAVLFVNDAVIAVFPAFIGVQGTVTAPLTSGTEPLRAP
jgi:hypothetical protein